MWDSSPHKRGHHSFKKFLFLHVLLCMTEQPDLTWKLQINQYPLSGWISCLAAHLSALEVYMEANVIIQPFYCMSCFTTKLSSDPGSWLYFLNCYVHCKRTTTQFKKLSLYILISKIIFCVWFARVYTCSYVWVWHICVQVHVRLCAQLCIGHGWYCSFPPSASILFIKTRSFVDPRTALDTLASPKYTLSLGLQESHYDNWAFMWKLLFQRPVFMLSQQAVYLPKQPIPLFSKTLHFCSSKFPWTPGLHTQLFSPHFQDWHFIFNISKYFSAVETLFLYFCFWCKIWITILIYSKKM